MKWGNFLNFPQLKIGHMVPKFPIMQGGDYCGHIEPLVRSFEPHIADKRATDSGIESHLILPLV